MTNNTNKITLIELFKARVLNTVNPVLVRYEMATLSGGDIPVYRCPACGREFTVGHHCKCGAKFDWSKLRKVA